MRRQKRPTSEEMGRCGSGVASWASAIGVSMLLDPSLCRGGGSLPAALFGVAVCS